MDDEAGQPCESGRGDGQQLHESTVLSYSSSGRNKTVMLAPDEIARVRAAVARYRDAQAKLEEQGNAGLDALVSRRAARQAW